MILLQSNPQFLERWEALPDEQRERFGRDHRALSAAFRLLPRRSSRSS
jgi:hypothetical protein